MKTDKTNDGLPGDWYVYQSGNFCHSCRTREAAIEWAKEQIQNWRYHGSYVPEYKVAYNQQPDYLPEVIEANPNANVVAAHPGGRW